MPVHTRWIIGTPQKTHELERLDTLRDVLIKAPHPALSQGNLQEAFLPDGGMKNTDLCATH